MNIKEVTIPLEPAVPQPISENRDKIMKQEVSELFMF